MNHSFKVGDVVILKSHSPKMTVQEINGQDITCIWFNHENEPQVRTFLVETLKLYEKPSTTW